MFQRLGMLLSLGDDHLAPLGGLGIQCVQLTQVLHVCLPGGALTLGLVRIEHHVGEERLGTSSHRFDAEHCLEAAHSLFGFGCILRLGEQFAEVGKHTRVEVCQWHRCKRAQVRERFLVTHRLQQITAHQNALHRIRCNASLVVDPLQFNCKRLLLFDTPKEFQTKHSLAALGAQEQSVNRLSKGASIGRREATSFPELDTGAHVHQQVRQRVPLVQLIGAELIADRRDVAQQAERDCCAL
mmetsp:Transcript_16980/g.43381  ORF Transcript_16980/g.43381 Transcript_16980/m.43381 type:complete len:241 (+) Transcript_16980:459-1181(+)